MSYYDNNSKSNSVGANVTMAIQAILSDLESKNDSNKVQGDILPLMSAICRFDSTYGANKQSVSLEGLILEVRDKRTEYAEALCKLLSFADSAKLNNMLSNLSTSAKQPNITGIGVLRILHDTVYFLCRKYNKELKSSEMHGSLSAFDVAIPSSRLCDYLIKERSLGVSGKIDQALLDRVQDGEYLDDDQMVSDFISWSKRVTRSNLKYNNTAIQFLNSAYNLVCMYERVYEKSKKAWRVDSDVILTEPNMFKNKVMCKSSAGSNEIRYEPFAVIEDILPEDIKLRFTGCKFVKSSDVERSITRMSISNDNELSVYCFLYLVTIYTGIAVELTRVIKEMYKSNNILASVSLKQAYTAFSDKISFPIPTYLQPGDLPSVKWTGIVPNYAMSEYMRLFSQAKIENIEETARDMLNVLGRISLRGGWTFNGE